MGHNNIVYLSFGEQRHSERAVIIEGWIDDVVMLDFNRDRIAQLSQEVQEKLTAVL